MSGKQVIDAGRCKDYGDRPVTYFDRILGNPSSAVYISLCEYSCHRPVYGFRALYLYEETSLFYSMVRLDL